MICSGCWCVRRVRSNVDLDADLEGGGEGIDLVPSGQRRDGAGLGRCEGAGGRSLQRGLLGEFELVVRLGAGGLVYCDPANGEGRDEGVARPDRIHRLHTGGGNSANTPFVGEDRALSAQREEDCRRAKIREAEGEAPRLDVGVLAREGGGLVAIDDENIHRFEEIGRKGSGGGGVEDDGLGGRPSDAGGLDVGRHGNFELENQRVRILDQGRGEANIVDGDQGVGAGRNDDGVLAGIFDGDHAQAAGRIGRRVEVGRVDVVGVEDGAEPWGVGIIAHATDDGDERAESSGGDGLVGALPAGIRLVRTAKDGLAVLWKMRATNDQVHVEGAEDAEAWRRRSVGHGKECIVEGRGLGLIEWAWSDDARTLGRP